MSGDAGAAAERTVLAWQRTALALIAGAAVLGRLQAGSLGPLVVVPLGGAAALAGWILLRARRADDRDVAVLTAAAAAATVLLATTELIAVAG